ncbi:patched domain-containing protein 3-like [Centruroides vittatus]|uniref:patched domain-containing protein 3-like n=1 Tax=Centruroides vittatus TaxID=120091 RepID=UPI00350F80EF
MKFKYLSIYLSQKLKELGLRVGRNPIYFIVVPIIVSMVLATGLHKWHDERNIKYLFEPRNTRHVKEEGIIARLFPMDLSSDAYMERMNREPSIAVVLVTAKDEGSVLRKKVFREIIQLDEIIQNIKTADNFTYKDLCARNNKRCFENSILFMQNEMEMMENKTYTIKYPLQEISRYKFQLNSLFLGGVRKTPEDYVKSAKALRLLYYLNDDSCNERNRVEQWQNLFSDRIASSTFEYITVDRYTSITMEMELLTVMYRLLPKLPIAMLAVVIFSMLTCLYNSWIESKPWIGVIALISGGMSLASSFGLIMYFNTPFVAPAGSIPFLIIGIGMDDAFVFLAAWKKTDPQKTVPDRLSEVYSESAISVTVTSVTNFIAFISGLFTPFRAIFCVSLYGSIAVVFCYVYQLTFVGACMAFFGYMEKQGRHSLFFTKINTQKGSQSRIVQGLSESFGREFSVSLERDKVSRDRKLWEVTQVGVSYQGLRNSGRYPGDGGAPAASRLETVAKNRAEPGQVLPDLRYVSPRIEVEKTKQDKGQSPVVPDIQVFLAGEHSLHRLRPPELHAAINRQFPNPKKLQDVRYTCKGLLLVKTKNLEVVELALQITSLAGMQVQGWLAAECMSTGYVLRGVDTSLTVQEIYNQLERRDYGHRGMTVYPAGKR